MKREFRHDSRPYTPPTEGKYIPPKGQYVTAEEAYRHLTGQQSGAEQARLRMLRRMGLDREDGPAAGARERMIQRQQEQNRG